LVERKKILVFIDWYLPGFKAGGPIRSIANMVSNLSELYAFYIVTRNTDYTETQAYKNIEANKWLFLQTGEYVMYLDTENQNKNKYKEIINEQKWHCIFVNGIFSLKFSLLPLYIAKKHHCRVVLSTRGMLAPEALKVKRIKKQIFLLGINILGLFKNISIHCTNVKESLQAQKHIKGIHNIFIANNLPKKTDTETVILKSSEINNLKLVSIARIAPEKNLLFALESLLLIKEKIEITFDVYGPIYSNEYYEKCVTIVKQLPQNIRVNFMKSIDPNLTSNTLKKYDMLYMPTLGENYGHIIVEALQNFLPVLISDRTPWQKLAESNAGFDLSLNNINKFTSTITEVAILSLERKELMKRDAKKYIDLQLNVAETVLQYKSMFE
jgi:glycosyltransferase involved in cell wall biosynthesis